MKKEQYIKPSTEVIQVSALDYLLSGSLTNDANPSGNTNGTTEDDGTHTVDTKGYGGDIWGESSNDLFN
jgi:hypothetical protein